jgi:hypothetical protein
MSGEAVEDGVLKDLLFEASQLNLTNFRLFPRKR